MDLYWIVLPDACFGVLVDEDGAVRFNMEIGWWTAFSCLEELTEHVLNCGGTIEKVPPAGPAEHTPT